MLHPPQITPRCPEVCSYTPHMGNVQRDCTVCVSPHTTEVGQAVHSEHVVGGSHPPHNVRMSAGSCSVKLSLTYRACRGIICLTARLNIFAVTMHIFDWCSGG